MRKIIIGNCINFIKKYHPEYDEEKVSIIKYGLESIYIMITKLIFIFALAIILKIFKEVKAIKQYKYIESQKINKAGSVSLKQISSLFLINSLIKKEKI